MNNYFQQAREAHLKKLFLRAVKLYQKAHTNNGLDLEQKGFWLDALIAIGDAAGSNALLSEMQGDALTPEDISWLEDRTRRHEAALNVWAQRETIASNFNQSKALKEAPIKPFYISSLGGSATAWIAASLSTHPSLVCYHGTKASPPGSTSDNFIQLSADDFAKSLLISSQATRFKKIFGAVHGFHGTAAKDSFQNMGGTFCGVIRHPIERLKSLTRMHVGILCRKHDEPLFFDLDRNIFAFIREAESEEFNKKVQFRVEGIFRTIIDCDFQIYSDCGVDALYKMESLTSNTDYFRSFFNFITQGKLEASDGYFETVSDIKNQNRRVVNTKSVLSLDNWPDFLIDTLQDVITDFGSDEFYDFYNTYDYRVSLDEAETT